MSLWWSVAEANPLKQGLKLRSPLLRDPLLKVAEANPLKQGLKPIRPSAVNVFVVVAEANPLKQGLKHQGVKRGENRRRSCRG